MDLNDLVSKIKILVNEKNFHEIIDGKKVYEWIDELDLYKELNIPDPKNDELLGEF